MLSVAKSFEICQIRNDVITIKNQIPYAACRKISVRDRTLVQKT